MVEEPREQQQPALSPAYPSATPVAPPSPVPAPPSPLMIGERVARLLLGRAMWASEQGWRLVAPRIGWLVLTGFLVGIIVVLSLLLVLPRFVQRSPTTDPRVAALPPVTAVEDFLRGQQTYDADLMWASFSPELRKSLEGRNITRATLAQQVESERRAGQRYGNFKYIGGVEIAGHQRMYFYVVDILTAQQKAPTTFIFTVGSDGKIMGIK
ncbi:MAG: hypothetical protein WCP31_04780 [Chloroflexales bacterium]